MPASLEATRPTFYQRFLMARHSFKPQDFGIDMEKDAFLDLMVDEFGAAFHGQISLDEVLLRPRSAMQFCDTVRQNHGWLDLPDDIILRSVMQRRKGN